MKVLHRTTKEKTEDSLKLWEQCSKKANIECWSITVDDDEMFDTANDYDVVIIDTSLDTARKLNKLLANITQVVFYSCDLKQSTINFLASCH